MPAISPSDATPISLPASLPFPPLTKSHILNCSVHTWYPLYKSLTPRTRLIPLPSSFLSYLRADGIILPPEPSSTTSASTNSTDQPPSSPSSPSNTFSSINFDSGYSSDSSSSSTSTLDGSLSDPSLSWPEFHLEVQAAIKELGGKVHPKLNWSAPKDATWIAVGNTMECCSANEVYLLLKASDFVSFDLEEVWRGCVDEGTQNTRSGSGRDDDRDKKGGEGEELVGDKEEEEEEEEIKDMDKIREQTRQEKEIAAPIPVPYHLILRRTIPTMLTSMEFRCFVRRRQLLCISQRDLKYYEFMAELAPILKNMIYDFYVEKMKDTFLDESFVFDVYIPRPKEGGKVWLIDINPWAQRTDALLYSWLELLGRDDLSEEGKEEEGEGLEEGVVRLRIWGGERGGGREGVGDEGGGRDEQEEEEDDDDDEESDVEDLPFLPELRLIKRDDPENYTINLPAYSANKLPKDVVDAGMEGPGGMRDFLERLRRREKDPGYSSDEEDS